MYETEFFLRIACQRGELERVFQPELRAEQTQIVKKFDGFRINHTTGLKNGLDAAND
jgi:hypothetical protein